MDSGDSFYYSGQGGHPADSYLLRFLTHMLRYTRFAQKHTKDPIVWRISFQPGSGMTIRDLDFDTPEYDEVVNGEDREGFLPNSYYEHVRPQTSESETEETEEAEME